MIDGVIITDLRKIPDERGAIFHMLRKSEKILYIFSSMFEFCQGFSFLRKMYFTTKYEVYHKCRKHSRLD